MILVVPTLVLSKCFSLVPKIQVYSCEAVGHGQFRRS